MKYYFFTAAAGGALIGLFTGVHDVHNLTLVLALGLVLNVCMMIAYTLGTQGR